MRLKTSLFIYGICFLIACSKNTETIEGDSTLLKSLSVTYNGKIYHGSINSGNGTITIGGIEYGESVTSISYKLAAGATISPDPKSFERELVNDLSFTVTLNGKTEGYKLVLSDYIDLHKGDRPKDKTWVLTWEDEFDQSEIDWTVWSKTPRNQSDWNNTMSDADELYELKDGILVLKAIANTDYPQDNSPYLTGGIWGRGKKTFALGRVDIRARFDSGQGFWPAIWMMGENASWPLGGEIDIMEHLNFDNFIYQTIHTDYTNNVSKTIPPSHGSPGINKGQFNVYSVEVHADEVVFLVNDEITFRYPKLNPVVKNQYPFTERNFYLILSAQLGGSWVGAVDSKELPLRMEIDWVRFYEKAE